MNERMRLSQLSVFLFGAVLATQVVPTAKAQRPAVKKEVELVFGVYTSDQPTTMYRMFTPIMEELQEGAEAELKRPVSIEMKIYKTYEEALTGFAKGEVDFVRFGPASFVLTEQQSPKIEVLAVEQKKGAVVSKGMIVVRRESEIRSVADLRGKSFAFGDVNSTIGRYLAQDVLLKNGIKAEDLGSFAYLGRHDMVFGRVAVGDFDAGSIKSGTFLKLNKRRKLKNRGQLRAIATFDNVTKPWIARAGLPTDVKRALRVALLGDHPEEVLKGLKIDGFVAVQDQHFKPVRLAMKRAKGFSTSTAAPTK